MADIAIILALAAGALAGWRKGFIVPLVVQAGALLSLAALYAGPLNGLVPSGTAGLGMGAVAMVLGGTVLGTVGGVLIRLIHRFSVLRGFDKVAGVPLGAATAAVTLYVALVAIVVLDGWLSPLHHKTAVGVADLTALQGIAAVNPAFGAFADPAMLQTIAQAAATTPVAHDQLAKYSAALGFYEEQVRPQLVSSHIAPLVLSLGERLPVVGRHVEFPEK